MKRFDNSSGEEHIHDVKDFENIKKYDYELPGELIAQFPVEPRDSSRLLILDRATGGLRDSVFRELPSLLRENDLLVVNDTRVFPARLLGEKSTGGKVEIFLLEPLENGLWQALVKPGRRVKPGTIIKIAENLSVDIVDQNADGSRNVLLIHSGNIWETIEKCGHTPLPLYIDRPDKPEDSGRYQTVFAKEHGAVAAPTAGLHFTNELMDNLKEKGIEIAGVTLHVGWGTFRNISAPNIRDHKMHSEYYNIGKEAVESINSAIREKRRIVAVGTTTVRTLESAALHGLPLAPHSAKTDLFIVPGFDFKITKAIITNFHLPKSSLIVMISAFAGRDNVMAAYEHAIKNRYRFYSYGDAMLIE